MEAYTGFAEVYDLFMDNVPYKEWSQYLISLLQEYGILEGIVLELGCGTGKMTRLLAQAGYDMIGVDSSQEMLQVAREQEWAADRFEAGDIGKDERAANESASAETGRKVSDILYLHQDMREFEL